MFHNRFPFRLTHLKSAVNVVICEGSEITRAGLNLIFSRSESINVVGLFQDSDNMLDFLNSSHEFEGIVVIIDFQLGRGQSVLGVPKLYNGSSKVRWFLLSSFVDKVLIHISRVNGFSGCMGKEVSIDFIMSALIGPSDKFIFSPHLDDNIAQFEYIINAISLLTKRETEIIKVVCTGLSAKKCAEIMHISVLTLETHKKNIFRKFDIKSLPELMRIVTDFKLGESYF